MLTDSDIAEGQRYLRIWQRHTSLPMVEHHVLFARDIEAGQAMLASAAKALQVYPQRPVARTLASHVPGEIGYCEFLSKVPVDTPLYLASQPAAQEVLGVRWQCGPLASGFTPPDDPLRAATDSAYTTEDKAFHQFWYAHMVNDLMQPPLVGTSYSVARYVWSAAIRSGSTK